MHCSFSKVQKEKASALEGMLKLKQAVVSKTVPPTIPLNVYLRQSSLRLTTQVGDDEHHFKQMKAIGHNRELVSVLHYISVLDCESNQSILLADLQCPFQIALHFILYAYGIPSITCDQCTI